MFWRPGTLHRVDVAADGAGATVSTRRENLRTTLVGFHRMHRYGGGWLYDLWVVCYDLASLSLILFAISGVSGGSVGASIFAGQVLESGHNGTVNEDAQILLGGP